MRARPLKLTIVASFLLGSGAAAAWAAQAAGSSGAPAPVSEAGPSADQWAAKAREFSRGGSVFEALGAYERAVVAAPSRLDIRLEYADLLRTTGFWLRSATQYKMILQTRPDDVPALLGYGELLNAEYQFEAAADQFSRVLELSPEARGKGHALVGLGSAQFGLEDYPGAAKTFSTLLSSQPDSGIAVAFLAIARRKMGDLDESLLLWNRFLGLQPGVARAKIRRIELDELRAAIHQARQAVQTEPSNAAAWAALGRMLRRKPDLPGAEEAYSAARRLAPAVASYRFLLGAVQRDLGRWSEAASSFAGVGRDPVYGTLALYNLAYCARRAGDRAGEVRAWSEAVAANPRDIYAYGRYVQALRATRGLDLEMARVTEAARAGPGTRGDRDPLPFVRLALVREASGDRAAAQRAALDALRMDPNDLHAQKLLRDLLVLDAAAVRQALEDLGRPRQPSGGPSEALEAARGRGALLLVLSREKEAEQEFRKALAADPQGARDMVALASCARAAGRQDEALSLLHAARGAEPGYIYAHLDLALASLQTDRSDEAIAAAREAMTIAPDNPIAYSILGSALRSKGDLEKAARALEQAVAIDPMDQIGASRLLLAKIYGALGRNEDARETLKGDLPEDPEEIYRIAWEFVRDTYLDRTYKGQDWSSWEHRFDGRLRTKAQALGAVALMLSSLDDRSTRLRSPDQTATLIFTQRTDAPEFSRTGAALSTSKTVESRHLEDNVGYIAITNLDDPKLPGEVKKAVELMRTADGVILDLRGNQGGSDADIPRIAGLFVTPGTQTGTVVEPSGIVPSKAEAAAPDGKPILPEDKPVVVLVDRNTASSAENLVGSLRESRRAVVVGEKTYGKSGIQIPKLLPGGSIVLVVGAEHADLDGSVYTGVGIRPDVPVEGASTGDRSAKDPAVQKAREILKKRKPGSPK